jgi:hypothetical protein
MTYAVPEAVADNVIAAAREGRAIQNKWRGNGGDGKELVCALAAFGPNINSPKDCPAGYMPNWLAHLIPALDDGIAADQVVPFFVGLGMRAKLWSVLDLPAWERVRIEFLSHCVRDALSSAESVCPQPRPARFTQVRDTCEMVLASFRSNGDLDAADAAAYAARNAAYAATYAAAYAARNAARNAAYAAAHAASYQRQVDALFAALDAATHATINRSQDR